MSRSRSRSPSYRKEERGRSRSVSRSPARSHSRSRSPVDRRSEERYNDRRGDRYDDRREDRGDRRSRRDDRGESTSVLVRHLNYKTTVDELRKVFTEFGEVVDVYLPLDYHSRRPRGFGFVQFSNGDDANAARKAVDQTEIDGSRVEVVIAQQNRKSPGTMRRFGRRNDDRYDDRRGGRGYRDGGYSRERRRSYSRSRSGGRRDRRY
jgi:RNA recognition motif-containing protein